MRGTGTSYGAATIVNAMPSGFGGAIGVWLKTVAEVEITEDPTVEAVAADQEVDDCSLVVESFRAVTSRYGLSCGARIMVRSEIPPARGMKSSSAASNAVVLATLDALGIECEEMEAVRMGVLASKKAGVTVTGAFDDACASLFGGVFLTDNAGMRVLRSWDAEELTALFLVPEERRYSGRVDTERLRSYARVSLMAFNEAIEGRVWQAMLINGMAMARILGFDTEPILEAVKEGAASAGLCGKGPAICAVAKPECEGRILDCWRSRGDPVIRTKIRGSSISRGEEIDR
ncbi:MAG: shikimate kinase [Candidatus Methanosuratincola sp.]|jgi:shikimate kinase|nr:shikimate kinase [Candidatus Methanosuratincola sp.]